MLKDKWLMWTPRVLSMAFIGFLALFSLDVIQPGLSARELLLALLGHNIPAILLLAVLIVAWRRAWVGAVAFIGAGLLYVALVTVEVITAALPWYLGLSWSLVMALPAMLVGAFFWFSDQTKSK